MQPLGVGRPANINLSFGTINVAVSVHGAVGDADRGMHTVCTHEHDATRIKQHQVCPVCGNDGQVDPFAKARDDGDGLVVIPVEVQEEAKEAAKAFKKGMTLTAHPADQVSAALMPSGKSYYLGIKSQGAGALKAYHSLVEAVRTRPDLAFMTKLTLSTAVSVFQLTVAGQHTLVLRQMGDAELVRAQPEIAPIDLSNTERKFLALAVDAFTEPFEVDVHGTGLSKVIAEYAATQTPVAAGVPVQGGVSNVVDMTEMLRAMAEARRGAVEATEAAETVTAVEAADAEVQKVAAPRRRRKVTTEGKAAS